MMLHLAHGAEGGATALGGGAQPDAGAVGTGFFSNFGTDISGKMFDSIKNFGTQGMSSLTGGYSDTAMGGFEGLKGLKDAGGTAGLKDSMTSGMKNSIPGTGGSGASGGATSGGAGAASAAQAALTIAQNTPGPTDFKIMMGMDFGCFLKTWRVTGLGGCWIKKKGIPYYHICIKYEHKWATGLVEVFKQEKDSNVKSPMATAANYMSSTAAMAALKGIFGASRSSNGADEGNSVGGQVKQYFDGRLYAHPNVIPWMQMIADQTNNPYLKIAMEIIKRAFCNPQTPMVIMPLYNTEQDFMFWRTGLHDMAKLASIKTLITAGSGCSDAGPAQGGLDSAYQSMGGKYCIGNYGPIYPRKGFVSQFNVNAAAHVIAFRVISMANKGSAVKMGAYQYTIAPGGSLQMYEPEMGSCFAIKGNYISNPHYRGKLPESKYMWSHWPTLECCDSCYVRQAKNGE